MKYAGKKTLFLMHAWSPRKFVYCCEFNHSFAQNIIFLTNIIFIQGAFKNIQGLLWKIQGLFTDIQQFSNFQGFLKACVRTMPWITQGLRGLKLKFYSELLGLVNRDSLKGITSYDTFSPRTI